MSIWRWKKSGESAPAGQPAGPAQPANDGAAGKPPTASGEGGAGGKGKPFEPQPEKARKFFESAQAVAATQSYEYALLQFAFGVRLDPTLMSAHEAMFEAGVQHMKQGGSAATGKEIRQIEGSHPIERFAAAEFAWFKDLQNASLALKFIEATIKAGLQEIGHWAAPKVLAVLKRQKKPSKSQMLQAKDAFAQLGVWDQAVEAGEFARRIDPTDSKLDAELKDLIAQRTMDRAGYAEAAGKEGGFQRFVKDMEKQRGLTESEAISATSSIEERNFERALAEYEKSPNVPDVISRFAAALRKRGRPEDELRARDVYMRGYQEIGEYRFRMAAGDLMMEEAKRRVVALRSELEKRGSDAGLKAELDVAILALQELQAGEFAERVSKYPTDRKIKMQLGEVLFEQGRFSDAMPQFQAAKDEPRLRTRAGYMLGRAFAAEGWHREAIDEYKEALDKLDVVDRELENHIRYDRMESLIAQAREERAVALAREALSICSDIARKDIAFRDIRAKRKEIDQLVKELGGSGPAPAGAPAPQT